MFVYFCCRNRIAQTEQKLPYNTTTPNHSRIHRCDAFRTGSESRQHQYLIAASLSSSHNNIRRKREEEHVQKYHRETPTASNHRRDPTPLPHAQPHRASSTSVSIKSQQHQTPICRFNLSTRSSSRRPVFFAAGGTTVEH